MTPLLRARPEFSLRRARPRDFRRILDGVFTATRPTAAAAAAAAGGGRLGWW